MFWNLTVVQKQTCSNQNMLLTEWKGNRPWELKHISDDPKVSLLPIGYKEILGHM